MLVETWVEEFASAANDDRMHALSALVAVLSGVERAAVQCELKYAEKKFDLINVRYNYNLSDAQVCGHF